MIGIFYGLLVLWFIGAVLITVLQIFMYTKLGARTIERDDKTGEERPIVGLELFWISARISLLWPYHYLPVLIRELRK